MILFIWSVTIVVVIALYFHRVYSTFRKQGVKNSRIVPILGNMGKVLFRLEHFPRHIERIYNEFPSERFFGRFEFLNAQVVIRDIELVKKIAIRDIEYFLDHRLIVTEEIDPLIGKNLFSMRGQEWKDMRSSLSPAFTSAKIKMMVPFILEISQQLTKSLIRNIDESGDDYVDIEGKDLTARFAIDVIATCAFGLKVDSLADAQNQFYTMGRAVSTVTFKQLLKLFGFVVCPKIMKFFKIMIFMDESRNFFKNLVMNTMKDREERHIIRCDMIHLLMEAKKGRLSHDETSEKGGDAGFATVEESVIGRNKVNRVWTDDDIAAQAILFFMAGFETVSSAMSFLLHELAVNPEVQERLAQEIRDVEINTGGNVSYNIIQNMVYMDMVVSDTMILLIWSVVFVAAVALYLHRVYSAFSKHGVKNSKVFPVVGNLGPVILQREHIIDHIERLYNEFPDERFIVRFEFIYPLVMIRDIELVKKITIKDFEHFLDHRTIVNEEVDTFFGRNLFSLKGQEWKDMRSTLSPAFTSSKMKLMLPFMMEVGDQMIKSLNTKIEESGVNYFDIDCKDFTTRYANDVIATCAFGLQMESLLEEHNEFYAMGKTISTISFSQSMKLFGFTSFPTLMKFLRITLFSNETKNFFKDLVLNTMQNREIRNIIRPDMIHLLMEAKKGKLRHDDGSTKDVDAGFATVEESAIGKKQINRVWNNEDLIAQVVLFFIAGFETISTAMSFLLHELAVNPDVQERLFQEIKTNEAKNNGKFDYNSVQNMVYMDMVVSEVLRLWPPALALDRICVKDYNLGKPNDKAEKDFILRKGVGISVPVSAFHRNPQFFSNPLKFDPERFSEENKHKIQPFTYMPFGLGPRNCIGSRFALYEVKVMTYQLLLHMDVSPCEKTCIPAKLSKQIFNLKIDGGHWIRLKTRT